MSRILTTNLPEEQKKRLHPDFVQNERDYWRMRERLIQHYQGQWVAVDQGQVVAVGHDIFDVTEQVGKLGCHAYIAKVGEEDTVVFHVRRREFAYDTSYQPFALPRAAVTFSNFAQTHRKLCPDTIPDTGADISLLPDADGRDIDLFSSPYFVSQSRGVVGPSVTTVIYRGFVEINGLLFPSLIQSVSNATERLLGRDVLNQMKANFDGPKNRVSFEL
ncbi:MAG: DUF5678 domain-containing protein [Candidatus Bipolaricaulota bacterium]|nr:DUF5678 domain-containing protein [Candidatus Bipolaricaulota bacterium]